MATDVFLSPAQVSPREIQRIVQAALAEDLASGDVTSRAVVPPGSVATADMVAREPLVLAGLALVAATFAELDPGVEVAALQDDGAELAAGAVVARLRGPAHSVLAGERTALNFVQRLSGVATRTRSFTRELPAGSRTRITDTRKTTPGLRALERYAVRLGGGHNHRNDLGAGVLIKDNHLAVAGGVQAAITRARAQAPHTMRIECEVQGLDELDQALAAGADVVMLDNFDDDAVRAALGRVQAVTPRPLIEVSGGVTRERIARLAAMGVDVISVGSLTHGARAVDLALDVRLAAAWKTSATS